MDRSFNFLKWLLHRRRCRNSSIQNHKIPTQKVSKALWWSANVRPRKVSLRS